VLADHSFLKFFFRGSFPARLTATGIPHRTSGFLSYESRQRVTSYEVFSHSSKRASPFSLFRAVSVFVRFTIVAEYDKANAFPFPFLFFPLPIGARWRPICPCIRPFSLLHAVACFSAGSRFVTNTPKCFRLAPFPNPCPLAGRRESPFLGPPFFSL